MSVTYAVSLDEFFNIVRYMWVHIFVPIKFFLDKQNLQIIAKLTKEKIERKEERERE